MQRSRKGWVSLCGNDGIRLGITSENGQVVFLLDAPGKRQRVIAAQLENAYPGGKTSVRPPQSNRESRHKQRSWLRLSPDVYPLKLHHEFIEGHSRNAIDPIEGLLEIIKSGRSGRVSTTLWLELKPLKTRQGQRARRNAAVLEGQFPLRAIKKTFERHFSSSSWNQRLAMAVIRRLVRTRGDPPESVQEKLSHHLFAASIYIETSVDDGNRDFHQHRVDDIQSSLSLLTAFSAIFFVERRPKGSFLLSAAEIATLWHIPTVGTQVPRLDRAAFKELEPPPSLPRPGDSHDIVTLGRVCFRNERYKFGIDIETRRRHLWILGKTGMGKTTLLQSIIKQDLDAGMRGRVNILSIDSDNSSTVTPQAH